MNFFLHNVQIVFFLHTFPKQYTKEVKYTTESVPCSRVYLYWVHSILGAGRPGVTGCSTSHCPSLILTPFHPLVASSSAHSWFEPTNKYCKTLIQYDGIFWSEKRFHPQSTNQMFPQLMSQLLFNPTGVFDSYSVRQLLLVLLVLNN